MNFSGFLITPARHCWGIEQDATVQLVTSHLFRILPLGFIDWWVLLTDDPQLVILGAPSQICQILWCLCQRVWLSSSNYWTLPCWRQVDAPSKWWCPWRPTAWQAPPCRRWWSRSSWGRRRATCPRGESLLPQLQTGGPRIKIVLAIIEKVLPERNDQSSPGSKSRPLATCPHRSCPV